MKKSFYITLITCSSLLLIPTACSQTQTSKHNQSILAAEEVANSIQQTASAITVKISIGSSSGSGILIAQARNTYTVVTNAHVISRGNNYQITTADGKTHQATLKKSDQSKKDDLALLQFQATEKYTIASLGNAQQVTPGQSVFAVGFGDGEEQLTFNSGKIAQISQKPLVGGYQIGFTNSTKQGMSGGALLNQERKVIGILGMGAAAVLNSAYLYADGSSPNAQMLEQLRANSLALPVTNVVSSLPEAKNKDKTDTTVISSKKYTGLPGKIDNIAQQITVRIDSKNNGNGSGVIIAHEGDTYYVATAGHVVQNEDNYTVVTPDGQLYPIENSSIKTFEGLDLAVVQFQSQEAYTVATLGKYDLSNEEEARWVFVSGFPAQKANTKIQSPRLLTAGIVQSEEEEGFEAKDSFSLTDGYGLLYTNQSFPGMSGGAVLDSQGRVVGINTGAEDEVAVDKTGNVAEISLGYSLGVPINTLIGLVQSAKIKPQWLKQEISKPNILTKSEIALLKEELFDLKQPTNNATEVDWLNYGNQLWRSEREVKVVEFTPRRSEQADKAVAAFERAIELNPNSHYAYYGKGLAFGQQRKFQQAKDAYQQATKLAPDFYPAWRGMGNSLEQSSEAIKAYSKAIQLQPQGFVAYVERGSVYKQLENYQAAIADFNEAIKIQPHPTAYSNRGSVYEELKNYQAAIADYNKAIEINPNDDKNHIDRGNLYRELKDYQAAIADYTKAIEVDPNTYYYRDRGDFYKELKDYQAAIADYTKAIEVDPDNAFAYIRRSDLYKELKNYQAALADYTKAIEVDPNPDTYQYRGNLYKELNKYQAAIDDYTKAIELDLHNAHAYTTGGDLYKELKNYQAALADYQKAGQLYQQEGDIENYQEMQQILKKLQDDN